jgi:hypothetical protein
MDSSSTLVGSRRSNVWLGDARAALRQVQDAPVVSLEGGASVDAPLNRGSCQSASSAARRRFPEVRLHCGRPSHSDGVARHFLCWAIVLLAVATLRRYRPKRLRKTRTWFIVRIRGVRKSPSRRRDAHDALQASCVSSSGCFWSYSARVPSRHGAGGSAVGPSALCTPAVDAQNRAKPRPTFFLRKRSTPITAEAMQQPNLRSRGRAQGLHVSRALIILHAWVADEVEHHRASIPGRGVAHVLLGSHVELHVVLDSLADRVFQRRPLLRALGCVAHCC